MTGARGKTNRSHTLCVRIVYNETMEDSCV